MVAPILLLAHNAGTQEAYPVGPVRMGLVRNSTFKTIPFSTQLLLGTSEREKKRKVNLKPRPCSNYRSMLRR